MQSADPQVDKQGVCAFLTYFIMAGYQFRQAQAVLDRLVSYSDIVYSHNHTSAVVCVRYSGSHDRGVNLNSWANVLYLTT